MTSKRMQITFPDDEKLFQWLSDKAEKDLRSVNMQIIYFLRERMSQEMGSGATPPDDEVDTENF